MYHSRNQGTPHPQLLQQSLPLIKLQSQINHKILIRSFTNIYVRFMCIEGNVPLSTCCLILLGKPLIPPYGHIVIKGRI